MSCVPARALFHTAPRCVEIRELPTPRPAAGEVLVRTVCSGISGGTERLVYRGEVPAELALDDTIDALGGTFSYPFAYGYACVGEVAESGQAVFAFHPHQDIFAARASELIPLPGIDPASATLLPLVETALQVTLDAGTGYRDRVIVLGAGVLGLLTGLLLQRSGWRPLIAEPLQWRRTVASSLGVTTAAPAELENERFRWSLTPAVTRMRQRWRWTCWPTRGPCWSRRGSVPNPWFCRSAAPSTGGV
jgi:threonine dehydrogenase-like Zn-dependent dehydrogenase